MSRANKWICRRCGQFLPRFEAETLGWRSAVSAQAAKCSHCGRSGTLYPATSPEGADYIKDMSFAAYAASLQLAGYRVVLFSAECNHGSHQHCTGQNEFTADTPQEVDLGLVHVTRGREWAEKNRLPRHCFCPCHKSSEPPQLPDSRRYAGIKQIAEAFVGAYAGPAYDAARRAGLTEVQARRVADAVMASVSRQLARELVDEISFGPWLRQIIQREIARELGSTGETPDPPGS
jgi:hypothetical protein